MVKKTQIKRMGRPPIKDTHRRSKVITIRLRPSEYEQLARDAGAAGRTVAEHLRQCWREARG